MNRRRPNLFAKNVLVRYFLRRRRNNIESIIAKSVMRKIRKRSELLESLLGIKVIGLDPRAKQEICEDLHRRHQEQRRFFLGWKKKTKSMRHRPERGNNEPRTFMQPMIRPRVKRNGRRMVDKVTDLIQSK